MTLTRYGQRLTVLTMLSLALLTGQARGQQDRVDPLPSWNDGATKIAILAFVHVATDKASPKYVPPEQRITTFDMDGTLWVEHPMYTQVLYCLDRVKAVVRHRPHLKDLAPFKTVLSGNYEAIAKLAWKDIDNIVEVAISGMTVEAFQAEVSQWLATARHPRWKRPYTDLAYQPMLEVLQYLRANGFKTHIVTGSGQDFVRVFAEKVYGIPPEQVVGSAGKPSTATAKTGNRCSLKSRSSCSTTTTPANPREFIWSSGVDPAPPSATHPAIVKCWNTREPATAPG